MTIEEVMKGGEMYSAVEKFCVGTILTLAEGLEHCHHGFDDRVLRYQQEHGMQVTCSRGVPCIRSGDYQVHNEGECKADAPISREWAALQSRVRGYPV